MHNVWCGSAFIDFTSEWSAIALPPVFVLGYPGSTHDIVCWASTGYKGASICGGGGQVGRGGCVCFTTIPWIKVLFGEDLVSFCD